MKNHYPIFQVEKLRLRDVKQFDQGLAASKVAKLGLN